MQTQSSGYGKRLSDAVLEGGIGLEMSYGRFFTLDPANNVVGCCTLGAAAFAEFGELATAAHMGSDEYEKRLVDMLVRRFPVLNDTFYTDRLINKLNLEIPMSGTPLWVAITNISDSSGATREGIALALSELGL